MVRQWGLRSGSVLFALGLGFIWLLYWSGLATLWLESEEYGHGGLVLLVLGYLLYRRRTELQTAVPTSTWPGSVIAIAALAVMVIGAVSGISQLEMYAVWLLAVAASFAFGGAALFRKLLVPLLIAFMVIPMPNALEPALTAQLQLISSQLGVLVIRMFGGVVYLEGNMIDMGGTQLLVAEACAGLRYLYPLMSLGAIGGYLLQAPVWMRWLLFLSTIPITIFMNSFRIGVTGLLVENFGSDHTDGFLHFFEGWVVFIVALLTLMLVALILVRFLPGKRSLFDVFSFDSLNPAKPAIQTVPMLRNGTLLTVGLSVFAAGILAPVIASRSEVIPDRQPLVEFPVALGEWNSREYRLPAIVEAVAGASEYYYGDFFSPAGDTVNLYVSYYETQRQGQIPHSPAVCIPGDGWVIESHEPVTIRSKSGGTFEANRMVTSRGATKVLAYYWLKQGDRMYRQELMARLDLVRSAALEGRTDGALIRLVTQLKPGESMADVDVRLGEFGEALTGVLPAFVPD